MDKEKARRTEELTEEEYKRRVAIAHKMIDVQKELLATHKPVQVRGILCEVAGSIMEVFFVTLLLEIIEVSSIQVLSVNDFVLYIEVFLINLDILWALLDRARGCPSFKSSLCHCETTEHEVALYNVLVLNF